ncbi:hypothetical protein ACGFSB_02115 [Streptomyces sp. NPDC048441]|uniref:hypothetical protein n=1 Tax=Streptomyces sp. NPDC048441 TaxID=3365552 RepID=UPI003717F716
MEYSAAAHHWVTEAATHAAKEQGAGNLLRIVLIVMVVGCVLVGWLLLRGYRQGADAGTAPDAGEGAKPGASSAEGSAESRDGDRVGRDS